MNREPNVERVLPWRRADMALQLLDPILDLFDDDDDQASQEMIRRAFELAENAHRGQMRKSGEPYILHPVCVAGIVAEQTTDPEAIVAALLHDAVEDTSMTLDDLLAEFTPAVADIVDGVTKLETDEFDTRAAAQAATIRKMFAATSKDLRVLIIKLADRLHNLRTIAAMPREKQVRIAEETFKVYVPLANRLGMQIQRRELEDLAFAAQFPERYAEMSRMDAMHGPDRDMVLIQAALAVEMELENHGVTATVVARPKHLFGVYEKMVVKNQDFAEVNDLLAIRVLVDTVSDCYSAMGCIHRAYKPVMGRIKDYIALPKFNDYQSLHTTVIGPGRRALEIQIRTHEMHEKAEFGVASYWQYKSTDGDVEWLKRIVSWHSDSEQPDEVEDLRVDLGEEISVLTPTGETIVLPAGATPVDFAYAIHTDIGHRCVGARVDNRIVRLDEMLESGAVVRIQTAAGDNVGPSRSWLDSVVSQRAKTKIRSWLSREDRHGATERGRQELIKAFRLEGLPVDGLVDAADGSATVDDSEVAELASGVHEQVLESLHHDDLDSMLRAIGEEHLSVNVVVMRFRHHLLPPSFSRDVATDPDDDDRDDADPKIDGVGIHVEGKDDLFIRLAKCCKPVPNDEIMGFQTRGRGVSVHRCDCSNAVSLSRDQTERLIDVEWDHSHKGTYNVSIALQAIDAVGLLAKVTSTLTNHGINIINATSRLQPDRTTQMHFDFEMTEPAYLFAVMAEIRGIDGIFQVERFLPE